MSGIFTCGVGWVEGVGLIVWSDFVGGSYGWSIGEKEENCCSAWKLFVLIVGLARDKDRLWYF